MHAHASLSMPLFDTLLPATREIFAENHSARFREFSTDEPIRSNVETLLSMGKLYDRLSLLAQLELPCTISVFKPALHLYDAVIKAVELGGESMTIAGDDFNLHLRAPNIHSIRLVNRGDAENGITSLDIHHSPGMLYASIQAASDGIGSAVWRDIMDNPTLLLP